MLLYCNFYHEEIRIIDNVDGDEKVQRRLCPECRERMERIIDDYVKQLTHHNDPPPFSAVSDH
jgi:hypothetical protein